MLVVDEAAYVSPQLIYQVVIPLLEVTTTVMFMISTPTMSYSFFSKLMHLKDKQGRSLFLVYSVDLVCQRCRKTAHPENCRHKLHLLPHWKNQDKLEMTQIIMQEETSILLRESRGIITDKDNAYLKIHEIDFFLKNEYEFPNYARPRYVLIAVDPNARAGKASSNMALFAMTLDGGMFTVSYFFCYDRTRTQKQRRGNHVENSHIHQEIGRTLSSPTQKIIRFHGKQFKPVQIGLWMRDS